MCLYCWRKNPKIAKKDIVCYKVLLHLGEGAYITPYAERRLTLAEKRGQVDFVANGNKSIAKNLIGLDRWYYRYKVNKGYIHTFKNRKDAVEEMIDWRTTCKKTPYVFKCIIPKGTEYYKGTFGDVSKSYCSDKIRIIEKVA
jgi:hypothetical protein